MNPVRQQSICQIAESPTLVLFDYKAKARILPTATLLAFLVYALTCSKSHKSAMTWTPLYSAFGKSLFKRSHGGAVLFLRWIHGNMTIVGCRAVKCREQFSVSGYVRWKRNRLHSLSRSVWFEIVMTQIPLNSYLFTFWIVLPMYCRMREHCSK